MWGGKRDRTATVLSLSRYTSLAGPKPVVALVMSRWVDSDQRYDRSTNCWKEKANSKLPTCPSGPPHFLVCKRWIQRIHVLE